MKKSLSFLLSTIIFIALATPLVAGTFSDVDEDQIYYDAIEFLAARGVVKGHPDGSYKPNDILNRAEMLKIIAEGAAKYYEWPKDVFDSYNDKDCFNDVVHGQWYTKYVCYGKEKGWVKGYDNGKYFKPSQKVNFVEGLKITFKGFSMTYNEDSDPWFKDLVVQAGSNNFIPYNITGFGNGLRRDQMADMITRMIKYDEGGAALEAYLGDRADIVATYETIEQGLDLSKLKIETQPLDDSAYKNTKKSDNTTKVEILDEIILASSKDPQRYIKLAVIEVKDKADFKEAMDFAGDNKDKFAVYYSSSGTKDSTIAQEAKNIISTLKFGETKEGLSAYNNEQYNFSLNFSDKWGEPVRMTINNDKIYTYTVNISSTAFTPGFLTIRANDKVKFVNQDDNGKHWPASNNHPDHTLYPGTDNSLCITAETGTMFDSCRGLTLDETFTFKFMQKGTWGYHDHINPSIKGTITVQ